MNTVERVARAMWERESIRATGRKRLIAWEDEGDDTHSTWMDRARAAIEALREPTPEMVAVAVKDALEGPGVHAHRTWPNAVAARWQMMIDAALGEPK